MSRRYKGPRKRAHKDDGDRLAIICAATQAVTRTILDALLWWISRGRF